MMRMISSISCRLVRLASQYRAYGSQSKCGSVTLLAYCHLRIFNYLVLPERAYNVGAVYSSLPMGGQRELMYPVPC
jgi:hypothetical protein